MGKGDYAAAGGSLKLKGVKDSKVEKKKKKRKFEVLDADKGSTTGPTDEITSEVSDGKAKQPSPDMGQDATEDDLASVGKTEAEKRHEEMRRQRVSALSFLAQRTLLIQFSWRNG